MAEKNFSLNRRQAVWIGAALMVLLLFSAFKALRPTAARLFCDFFYPYLALSRASVDRISDGTVLFYSKLELAGRLKQLSETNRHLAMQATAAGELLKENSELRRLLALPEIRSWKFIASEIILRDPLLWNEQLTINRGALHGVLPGAAAMTITPDGRPILVGVVRQVFQRSAEVLTIYNPSLQCSLRLAGSGVTGVLNVGSRLPSEGLLVLGYLPLTVKAAPGEAIVTTGFEDGIPGGVKVGELARLSDDPGRFSNELHQRALFRPAAQLNSIRFLMIAGRNPPASGK